MDEALVESVGMGREPTEPEIDQGGGLWGPQGETAAEFDPEDRVLGPLGITGVVALMIESLCLCTIVVGFVGMLVYGAVCLAGSSDATACGPIHMDYPTGGLVCLGLGWLPCTFCFCVSFMRRLRRQRNRIAPAPGPDACTLDVCYARAEDIQGTMVGPLPMFEVATRILRQALTAEHVLWPAGTAVQVGSTGIKKLAECVDMNHLWVERKRDWDEHRRIDSYPNNGDSGWGGPRQAIFEELREALFSGARVTAPVSVNVYDWSGRPAIT
jgi:hypothetical protein